MDQFQKKKKPNPQGKYALTKFQGEKIIKKYSKKYSYRYAVLRYFNVVGASKSGKIGEIKTLIGKKKLKIRKINKLLIFR